MSRLNRIIEKSLLRKRFACEVISGFEDTQARSHLKISYSQCGEDQIAWFIFARLGINHPTYLDIGAHHPNYLSNTALFYKLGARGINIEPDPLLHSAFLKHRPEDVNLNIGISSSPGVLKFYRMQDSSLSTFSESEARRISAEYGIRIIQTFDVEVKAIDNVLRSQQFCPDFLTIDVEGLDIEILNSYDFDSYRPAVICAETISFSLHGDGHKNRELWKLMAQKGYWAYADTYINTIFVDEKRIPGKSLISLL